MDNMVKRNFPVLALMNIPNFITLTGLFLGVLNIYFIIEHKVLLFYISVLMVSIMDTLDGFAAKKLDRLSPLGAELDSLCDGINFVLVPAIYAIVRMHMGIGTVIGAGVYCICGILRLGYYNMLIEENGEEKIFVGVPTTIASMFVLVAVWFLTVVCPQLRIAVPSVLVFCGLLMICRLEFHGTNRSRVWWALAGLGFMIAAVVIGR